MKDRRSPERCWSDSWKSFKEIRDDLPDILRSIPVLKRPRGNQRKRNPPIYRNVVCAFDIETSRKGNLSWMYIWQFQLGRDITIIGRSWMEFIELIETINQVYTAEKVLIFVHNLAYEWQYIRTLFDFQEEDVFFIDSRKPLKVTYGSCEFRCSFRLTNMDLDHFLDAMQVENPKTELDYSVTRYPDTELTEEELQYCINDVKGLVQAIYRKNELEHDTLYKMPLTSTGYVRRIVKKEMRSYNRDSMRRMQPEYWDLAMAMREAFRGGNTHTNRHYAAQILEKLRNRDRVSSYPAALMLNKYPIGRWSYHKGANWRTLQTLVKRKRAILMRVGFKGLALKNATWGCPYLSRSKCRYIDKYDDCYVEDNGRIISCSYLETTITDVDLFDIILKEYDISQIRLIDVWSASYGDLPKQIKRCIMKFYQDKTDLKAASKTDPEALYYYNQAKALLNSIYGMMCQNMLKPTYKYKDGDCKLIGIEDPESFLRDQNRKAWLNYAWGIWCTAYARRDLEEAMLHVGGDRFAYCDTDSVKYIDPDREVDWTEFNRKREKLAAAAGASAKDQEGNTYYLGTWDEEDPYDRAVFMGAKKYAYEINGKLGVTTAGVTKRKGLGAKELKKLENYKAGFTFKEAGGLEAKYVDDLNYCCTLIDGHMVDLTKCVTLLPSEYTLGLTGDYERLLKNPDYYLDFKGKLGL